MRTAHPVALVLLIPLTLSACGPLMVPAVQRLDEEEQRQVDSSWDNMLSPPNRLERQTLLDTLIMFQLHERGIDRLVARSEKAFSGGTVVMEINFERSNPKVDRFDVSMYDNDWNLQRRESYRTDEVKQVVKDLFIGPDRLPTTRPAEPVPPEVAAWLDQQAARLRAVAAATQPADCDD